MLNNFPGHCPWRRHFDKRAGGDQRRGDARSWGALVATPRRRLVVVLVASGLAVSGCGNDSADSSQAASTDAPAATEEVAAAEPVAPGEAISVGESGSDGETQAAGEAGGGAGTGSASFPVAPIPGRSIAYTAGMRLETADVAGAVTRIGEIATAAGGAVFDADVQLDRAGEEFGTLTIRVPPAGLGSTVAQIGQLGRVTARSQDAEDVTAQVIDLDARILTAEASVERVRGFLAEATNVSELAGLEAELTRRETDLEVLRAQQRGLAERVSLATLTIELYSPAAAPEVADQAEPTTVASAFRGGGRVLWSLLRGLAIVIAAALPFLAVILPLAITAWWIIRRTRRRRPSPPPTPLAPPTPGQPT